MTLKEFREKTKDFPETMDLFVNNRDPESEFQYESVESVAIEKVTFKDGKLKAKDDVIVIETA